MKERARTAGAEIVVGIGALQTIETGADSVIGPTNDLRQRRAAKILQISVVSEY